MSKAAVRDHVTPADGNVFETIGFNAEEAANLQIRSELMRSVRAVIAGMTQMQAARLLGVSQPRVSDLNRGKIGLFTIDALVNMLAHAGVTVRVTIDEGQDRRPSAKARRAK